MWIHIRAMNKIVKGFDYNNNEIGISALKKKADVTYTHCFTVVNKMIERGFVYNRKDGRSRFVKLSEKGLKLREQMKVLEDLF